MEAIPWSESPKGVEQERTLNNNLVQAGRTYE